MLYDDVYEVVVAFWSSVRRGAGPGIYNDLAHGVDNEMNSSLLVLRGSLH